MAQKARHKLELFTNTYDFFNFKAVFLGKTDKTLLGPKGLVVDV